MADQKQQTLPRLVSHLRQAGYSFVCPTPESQARVLHRRAENNPKQYAASLEDVFGWNLVAEEDILKSLLPSVTLSELIDVGELVVVEENLYRSRVRISNFHLPLISGISKKEKPLYYIHSAFPLSSDSVFFGPDTYLFINFLEDARKYISQPPHAIVDVCCGSGAGAIHMADLYPHSEVLGLDLNLKALEFGRTNAACADATVTFTKSNLYQNTPRTLLEGAIDVIVSNPPYIASESASGTEVPVYADGGAREGLELSERIVKEGLNILTSGGLIIIYTGVAISVDKPAYDPFLDSIERTEGVELLEYRVIHPDMWPEEIGQGAYADTGRIQTVGAVIRKST